MERPTLDKFPASVLAQIDIQTAFIVSRLIIAAERIQIFRVLHSKNMNAETIGRTLGIHELYLKPFLCSLVSLGLLRATNKRYQNTRFTEKYFIDERSIHWTRQYSRECVEAYDALTTLEEALTSGRRYCCSTSTRVMPEPWRTISICRLTGQCWMLAAVPA